MGHTKYIAVSLVFKHISNVLCIFLCCVLPALNRSTGHSDELLEEGWGFTPKCQMDDAERFQGCLPLTCVCSACDEVLNIWHIM